MQTRTTSLSDPAQAFLAARDALITSRGDQAHVAKSFDWPEMKAFNWAVDYFDPMAADNHDTALQIVTDGAPDEQYSFHDLLTRSNQVAHYMRDIGVKRGDRILLVLGNEVALWETMLGAFKLGAVVVPATEMLTPADLQDRIDRGKVRHVVTNPQQASKFSSLRGDWSRICTGHAPAGWLGHSDARRCPTGFIPDATTFADDPLLLYFTSGTTSLPKLVLHTHRSYPVGHLSTMYWLGLRPGDLHMNISSPGWAKHAWSCFFAPWNAGAGVFIYNTARFSARSLLGKLEKHGITSLCAPPTVWRMLIQEDLALLKTRLKLRHVIGAGEPLNPEVIAAVHRAWGLTLRDGYGQTETTAQIGNGPEQPVRPGSMGRVLPGYDVALLDANGHESNEGEICLRISRRPAGLMAGYEGDERRTEEVMAGGYYRTGDMATRDQDGYFTFIGRADDVFKASDYRISPFELESALVEHPAIAEAAVVPSPDPLRLAVPKAFLTLKRGRRADAEMASDIFRFVRERLAAYKRIKRIQFVEELPKTISGKIRRVDLRREEQVSRDRGGRAHAEYFEDDFTSTRTNT